MPGSFTGAWGYRAELKGQRRSLLILGSASLIGAIAGALLLLVLPPAAFKGLWDTVNQGQKWHGYVKNLRKDGAHYWVHAAVVPNIRDGRIVGFTSVRRKPSRSKVAEAAALYPTLF